MYRLPINVVRLDVKMCLVFWVKQRIGYMLSHQATLTKCTHTYADAAVRHRTFLCCSLFAMRTHHTTTTQTDSAHQNKNEKKRAKTHKHCLISFIYRMLLLLHWSWWRNEASVCWCVYVVCLVWTTKTEEERRGIRSNIKVAFDAAKPIAHTRISADYSWIKSCCCVRCMLSLCVLTVAEHMVVCAHTVYYTHTYKSTPKPKWIFQSIETREWSNHTDPEKHLSHTNAAIYMNSHERILLSIRPA